ncbi:MAG: hypothetical protein ABI851_16660 [Saprospiraceae bacterium]
MNILERIFTIDNPILSYKIPEATLNLLFDWFNESKISITHFETKFFEPLIAALRTRNHESKLLEDHFEEVRRRFYIQCAFSFLIGQYPNRNLLNRLSLLEKSTLLNDIGSWGLAGKTIKDYPEVFRPFIIGSAIAKNFNAIHARVGSDIHYSSAGFENLQL